MNNTKVEIAVFIIKIANKKRAFSSDFSIINSHPELSRTWYNLTIMTLKTEVLDAESALLSLLSKGRERKTFSH